MQTGDTPQLIQHRPMDKRVSTILQKQYLANAATVKLGQYVYVYPRENDVWLFNLLTKQVISVAQNEFDALAGSPSTTDACSTNFTLVLDEHAPALAHQLFENYFLVPQTQDEDSFYIDLLNMLDAVFPVADGIVGYTILPTTACNARCFYCFELGFSYNTMTDETVQATIDYIINNKSENHPVRISWFGGEPLLGSKQIRQICDGLIDAGVEYSSSMISNGILFDKDLVQEAKEIWRLKNVQITLDGYEEEHNRRKNTYADDISAYQLARRSIDLLADAEIRVGIRLNYDHDNAEEVKCLFNDLVEEYADNKYVRTYLAPIYGRSAIDELSNISREMNSWASEQNNGRGVRTNTLGAASLKRRYCMADNKGSVVIGAKGELYDCEHLATDRQWGTIFEGCTKPELYARMKEREPVSDECKGCMFLPHCTTYTGCPNYHMFCKDAYSERLAYEAEVVIARLEEAAQENEEAAEQFNVNCEDDAARLEAEAADEAKSAADNALSAGSYL